jgi:hypothetical protein
MDCRTITNGSAGGDDGNLMLRNHATGRAVPVRARTRKANKSQRGQSVGSEKENKSISPSQPTAAIMMAGIK